ncbi:MAG TPA: hypothetical protein VFN61_14200 [Acidimicrobiales bacterium]|nr:hypothetical protein [Acidimicrobiales bacterium]
MPEIRQVTRWDKSGRGPFAGRGQSGASALAGMAMATFLSLAWWAVPASAQFVDTAASGSQGVTAATVSAPSGLRIVRSPKKCTSGKQATIDLSWSPSTATDADGNTLVTYYGGYRALAGPVFTSDFSVTGNPPPTTQTDTFTCPAGAKSTTFTVSYYLVAGTGDGSGFIGLASSPVSATIKLA